MIVFYKPKVSKFFHQQFKCTESLTLFINWRGKIIHHPLSLKIPGRIIYNFLFILLSSCIFYISTSNFIILWVSIYVYIFIYVFIYLSNYYYVFCIFLSFWFQLLISFYSSFFYHPFLNQYAITIKFTNHIFIKYGN